MVKMSDQEELELWIGASIDLILLTLCRERKPSKKEIVTMRVLAHDIIESTSILKLGWSLVPRKKKR